MSLHLVFSAECNNAMTWQSVGLFHSHLYVKQPGNITRLLACSEEQLKTYGGMDAGPTFVYAGLLLLCLTLEDGATRELGDAGGCDLLRLLRARLR